MLRGRIPDYNSHLWNSDKPKLLRKKRLVCEVHAGLNRLVDGAMSEIHFFSVKLQVRSCDNSVDCKQNWPGLWGEVSMSAYPAKQNSKTNIKEAIHAIHWHAVCTHPFPFHPEWFCSVVSY